MSLTYAMLLCKLQIPLYWIKPSEYICTHGIAIKLFQKKARDCNGHLSNSSVAVAYNWTRRARHLTPCTRHRGC